MVETWSREDVRGFLSRTVTPIREFVRKLAYVERASPADLKVPPNVPETYEENLRLKGFPPLTDSFVDDRTGERVFALKPDVKKWAIEFFESEPAERPLPLERSPARVTVERERPSGAADEATSERSTEEDAEEGPREWTEDAIRRFLASATPIVQEFYRGLSDVLGASASQIGVPHTSPALAVRAAGLRGLPPLHEAGLDPTTGVRIYRLIPEAKSAVAEYYRTNVPPPRPPRSERRRRLPVPLPRRAATDALERGSGDVLVLHLEVDSPEVAARLFEVIRFLNDKNREERTFSLETDGRELILRIR